MKLENIDLGRHAPGVVNVILETPKGSRKGYKYNHKRRRFVIDCTYGVPVPTDYGWLPQTIGEDNKPLEAMIITRYNARPGYVYQVRPIGTLKQKNHEHKIICVTLGDERYSRIRDISDVDNKTLKRILSFFEPFFEFDGWMGREETYELIKESNRRYKEIEAKKKAEKENREKEKQKEQQDQEPVPEKESEDAAGDDPMEPAEESGGTDRPDAVAE